MTRRIDRALTAAGLPPLGRSAWVEVDLGRLTANASALAELAHPAALAPVVKADGYGHGLEMAARCAVAGGAQWLCVATAQEGIRLRQDGYEGKVLVLYPVPLAWESEMAVFGIDITVGSLAGARATAARHEAGEAGLEVHLEIDTGMTRGGVSVDDAPTAAAIIGDGPATTLAGVWTHFASPEDPMATERQLAVFEQALSTLARAGIQVGIVHAAASGGLLATDVADHTLVRPGLGFYGLHPDAGGPLPSAVSPALAVRAHPVRVAEVPAGTSVGYAATWTAARTSTVATLPVGYADGWSRSSSPGTRVLVEGSFAPVVGRVSSDSMTVDVTDVDGVDDDSEFTLLGEAGSSMISADDLARVRGTISWEVLQQLGSRLSRVYTMGPNVMAVRPESSTAITTAQGATLPSYNPDKHG